MQDGERGGISCLDVSCVWKGSQWTPGLSRREQQQENLRAGDGVYHTSRHLMAAQVQAKGELQLTPQTVRQVAHGYGHIILCEVTCKRFFFIFKGWLSEPKGWTANAKCAITERPVQKGGWISHSPSDKAGEHHDGYQSKHEQLWGDWTFALERRSICSSDVWRIWFCLCWQNPKPLVVRLWWLSA